MKGAVVCLCASFSILFRVSWSIWLFYFGSSSFCGYWRAAVAVLNSDNEACL